MAGGLSQGRAEAGSRHDELLGTDYGAVRFLTINRPTRLNALSRGLGEALGGALAQVDRDPHVRAVVLTGQGDRAFCAGGDLTEMAEVGDEAGSGLRIVADLLTSRPRVPLIAAVNGLAFGGGLELMLACDLAVAADHATFALPEVRRGLIASGGGLVRLPGIVGVRRALQLALTGQPVDAATALSWGLINEVVSADALTASALTMATTIATNAPLSVTASKAMILDGHRLDEAEAQDLNEHHQQRVGSGSDAREGPRAFTEKREPRWTGH